MKNQHSYYFLILLILLCKSVIQASEPLSLIDARDLQPYYNLCDHGKQPKRLVIGPWFTEDRANRNYFCVNSLTLLPAESKWDIIVLYQQDPQALNLSFLSEILAPQGQAVILESEEQFPERIIIARRSCDFKRPTPTTLYGIGFMRLIGHFIEPQSGYEPEYREDHLKFSTHADLLKSVTNYFQQWGLRATLQPLLPFYDVDVNPLLALFQPGVNVTININTAGKKQTLHFPSTRCEALTCDLHCRLTGKPFTYSSQKQRTFMSEALDRKLGQTFLDGRDAHLYPSFAFILTKPS